LAGEIGNEFQQRQVLILSVGLWILLLDFSYWFAEITWLLKGFVLLSVFSPNSLHFLYML
jgi:hypothetical protein